MAEIAIEKLVDCISSCFADHDDDRTHQHIFFAVVHSDFFVDVLTIILYPQFQEAVRQLKSF